MQTKKHFNGYLAFKVNTYSGKKVSFSNTDQYFRNKTHYLNSLIDQDLKVRAELFTYLIWLNYET